MIRLNTRCRAPGVFFLVACALAPTPSPAESPTQTTEGILGTPGAPREVVDLLRDTGKQYGPDAVSLQVQLLHYALQAGSILPAGVRIRGVEERDAHRYLVFLVDTGIVFNSRESTQQTRMDRIWSDIVIPTIGRLTACNIQADGITLEMTYFQRPYRHSIELQQTVESNPGRGERVSLRLLCRNILAFRRADLDGSVLFSRSGARVDEPPRVQPPDPSP